MKSTCFLIETSISSAALTAESFLICSCSILAFWNSICFSRAAVYTRKQQSNTQQQKILMLLRVTAAYFNTGRLTKNISNDDVKWLLTRPTSRVSHETVVDQIQLAHDKLNRNYMNRTDSQQITARIICQHYQPM
jgi:hypothetical protein